MFVSGIGTSTASKSVVRSCSTGARQSVCASPHEFGELAVVLGSYEFFINGQMINKRTRQAQKMASNEKLVERVDRIRLRMEYYPTARLPNGFLAI
jgi:hypothetical protein